jgi:hypothetical protein
VSEQGNGPEDFLLERLNEAASGDAAVRQLRRRYDMLRNDYENLLDRLGELEDRLAAPAQQQVEPAAPAPVSQSIAEAIAAPLLRLRDEYLAAAGSIQTVVGGLEGLAAGFKGQHGAPAQPRAASEPASEREPMAAPPQEARDELPRLQKTQIDVKGSGFGELLDFQERLSQLPGVSRVSISAIDNERATLVVELENRGN